MKATTAENIRKELKALADPKYRKFHSYLLPGTDNILGVRIPQLRTMAKEIIKKDDWRLFVETANTNYYEETMLQGMIIGLAKMNLDEQINYISLFIPRINNWAVCDIFSSELKTAVRKGEETVWQFIQPYLKSQKEFEILRELLTHQGRILTRQNLLDKLWRFDFYGDERVVDTHIKNLRKKLGIDFIQTIRGVGYKVDKENLRQSVYKSFYHYCYPIDRGELSGLLDFSLVHPENIF